MRVEQYKVDKRRRISVCVCIFHAIFISNGNSVLSVLRIRITQTTKHYRVLINFKRNEPISFSSYETRREQTIVRFNNSSPLHWINWFVIVFNRVNWRHKPKTLNTTYRWKEQFDKRNRARQAKSESTQLWRPMKW